MRPRSSVLFITISALFSLSNLAIAQGPAAPSSPCQTTRGCLPAPSVASRVSALFYLYRNAIMRHGPESALFGPLDAPNRPSPSTQGIGASLRFEAPLDPAQLLALESLGLGFKRPGPGLMPNQLGNVYAAWIPWDSLESLEQWPGLLRAEPAWHPINLRPTESTSAQVGAAQAHRRPDLGVTGKGVLIADIDSGIDVLHPAFFRADGPSFPWIDTNQNGTLDQGIDAIDYNKNGEVEPNERLRVLDSVTVLDYQSGETENNDKLLSASRDWVYIDANLDFERNAGPDEGFFEDDPAYGEPIFVVDDVDGDDRLGPNERLIQLKTSKIVQFTDGTTRYRRGENLIKAAQSPSLDDAFHGTGVAGILLGGQLGYHQRVGLAPDAELMTLSRGDIESQSWADDPELSLLQEAVSGGADMVLHEWTNPIVRTLDGSSNLEAAMDAARAQGVLQVNPLGNLNSAHKHIERPMMPGQNISLAFDVSEGFSRGGQLAPYSVIFTALQWEGLNRPTVFIVTPDNQRVQLPSTPGNQGVQIDGFTVVTAYETTVRNNTFAPLFIFSNDNQAPLPVGQWRIELEDIQAPATLVGRISDFFSSWAQGIGWTEFTPDLRSVSFPATADSSVGVAAYGGRHAQPQDGPGSLPGQLRHFSGRGPRLDNQRVVDIAAPDDPFAPMAASPRFLDAGYGRSWYSTFGGTSGAGPHVAASFALLKEQAPNASPDELEARLFESARQDDPELQQEQDLPNDHWGHGKLDVFQALYGEPAPENQRPAATLKASWDGETLRLDASESTDPDQDKLQARFDFNYDGQLDTAWSDTLEVFTQDADLLKPLLNAQPMLARVLIRDAHGATHGQLITVEPVDPSQPEADMGQGDMAPTPPRAKLTDDGCAASPSRHPSSPLSLFTIFVAMLAWPLRRHLRRTH